MLRPESTTEAAFRHEVREWLAAHVPDALRHKTFRPLPAEGMQWYRALYQRGWIAPHWPRAHGGMGASPVQQVILMEEMARAGTPDFPTQGLNHIGPLLIARGTPAQQGRHLPPILSGDAIWCQGYSEPGSGSDLASLRTRAELRGDTLVITGHKIWTTWGHHADWMFALVRTSSAGKPQHGITFVLIDMTTPGIRRRPIRTIAGDEEFAEVFFDDVVVPIENVVGEIDKGWQVATAVLSEERLRIGSPAQALRALERLRMMLRAAPEGRLRESVHEAAALAEVEVETLVAAYLEAAEAAEQGVAADSSYLKLLATDTVHLLLDLVQRVAGQGAALRDAIRHGDDLLDATEMFLQARRLGIYGGSSEVQRNIIATRVLGLPVAGSKA
ncbi:acyl-CoA dehydrogenase family protein [Cupriavidus sp. 2TAF22]|uniref:acyl-CoA dehydrogenase family protein n=1 Tax=unclassified Cupriavidus TaxID=2640874 RepID=UPI003F9174F0